MANKIRLGFIGANVKSTWASQSHYPALLASPDVEMTAVCTTRPETAEAARKAFGAKLARDPAWLGGVEKLGGIAAVRSPVETDRFVRDQYQLYERLAERLGLRP